MSKRAVICKEHLGPRVDGGGGNLQYPIRPGEKDCSYYLKFGTCRFGETCKFNHPPDEGGRPGASSGGMETGGGSVLHANCELNNNKMEDSNNDDHQEDTPDRSADSEQRTAKKPKGAFKQDDAAGGSKSAPTLVGAAVGAAKAVGRWVGISVTAGGAGEGEAGEPCEADVSSAFNTKVEQESRVIVKQRDQERHQIEEKLIKTEEDNRKLTQGIREIEKQGQQELRKMEDTLKQRDQERHQMEDKLIKTEEHNRKLTQGIPEMEKQGQQELRKMRDTLAKAEQEIQKMHIMQKQNASLQENNADALKKIHELTEQINVFRALSSAATPGNNHINKEFPSNSEIVASYSRFVTNILVDLLDNFMETDILWACAASKFIFTVCQEHARLKTLQPQTTFQEAVMVGKFVSEWEPTKVFMTKLQRATRNDVIECEKSGIEEFVEKERESKTGVLYKLLSQANYKHGSLESCIFKLLGILMDASLGEPIMSVDPSTIKNRIRFDKKDHEALGGTLKEGQQCIIVFPQLYPHDMAKAYVMPYDDNKEIQDTEIDKTVTVGIDEDESTVGGGEGKEGGEEAPGVAGEIRCHTIKEKCEVMSKRAAFHEETLWAIYYAEDTWYPAILGAQVGEKKFQVKFVGYEEYGWQDTADQDIQYRIPLARKSVLYANFQLNNKMEGCNNDDQQEDRSDRSIEILHLPCK